jgi:hypothetical protein
MVEAAVVVLTLVKIVSNYNFCMMKKRKRLTLLEPYFPQTSILCLASLAHIGWKEVLQVPE